MIIFLFFPGRGNLGHSVGLGACCAGTEYAGEEESKTATFDYDETGVTGFGWTNSYPKRNVWYPVAGSLKSDYTYAMHESLFFTATVASNGWIRVLSIQNNNAPSLKGISGSWANYAGSIRCVKE